MVVQGFWWDYYKDNYPFKKANYRAVLAPRPKAMRVDATFAVGQTAPLPVELVGVGAQLVSAAAVAWVTAFEINYAQFEVERSANGQHFQRLGSVAYGAAGTHQQTYSFRDKTAFWAAYYRLR